MPKAVGRIFADHCVHQDVVVALRELGYTVITAYEAGLAQASDADIFKFSLKIKAILLTFDTDFCNILRFDVQTSFGIVVVYIDSLTRQDIINHVINVFKKGTIRFFNGRLCIIQRHKTRYWPH